MVLLHMYTRTFHTQYKICEKGRNYSTSSVLHSAILQSCNVDNTKMAETIPLLQCCPLPYYKVVMLSEHFQSSIAIYSVNPPTNLSKVTEKINLVPD